MKVRELQHLAAAMAHEVRNPLNSMAIHTELLEGRLKRESPSEQMLKSVAALAREIERIDKILEEYLGYAGPREAVRRAVAPGALFDDVLGRVRAQAEERGVRLEARVEVAGAGRTAWNVDVEALGDAVEALVDSAVRASTSGHTVTLLARGDGDHAEVSVSDEGEAIAEDELVRVFHIGFRRARDGVSLAVARQIVKGHGGSLTVRREPPLNVFALRLPLEADE